MKSLYESILDDEDVLVKRIKDGLIIDKIKELIEKLNADTKTDSTYLQQKFFKDNDLLLDDKSTEKFLKNMVQNIKSKGNDNPRIKPGLKTQIAKGVEVFADIENINSISYGVGIIVDFVWGIGKRKEYIIYISEDYVYVLDNDATKPLLSKMDEYFSKYKKVDGFDYVLRNGKKFTRKPVYADGEYRKYDYKNMKKFFLV